MFIELEVLNGLQIEVKMEWIKAEDDLPMPMHTVLVKDGDAKAGWKVHVAFLTENYNWRSDDSDAYRDLYRVFEWMEIPD